MVGEEIYPKIEAMLFAAGEPLQTEKMAEAVGIEHSEFNKIMDEYIKMLETQNRGVTIVKMEDSVQMVTKSIYHEYVAKALESRTVKTLSQSALEVLSIIAYNQPVTKTIIDSIRGVDSYNPICRLLERELIEYRGRLNTIGHPRLYGTTTEFLRMFGLHSIHDLPPIDDFAKELVVQDDNLTFDDIDVADFE